MSAESSPRRGDSANRASKRSSLDHRFLNFGNSSHPVSRHSSLRRTSRRFSQSPIRPSTPTRSKTLSDESEILTQSEGLGEGDLQHPYGLSGSLTTEENESYHHNSPVIGRGSYFPAKGSRFQDHLAEPQDAEDEDYAVSRPPSVDLTRRGRPAESQLYNFSIEQEEEEDSEEDGGNFSQSLQIDMKDLFGDAVGNMSISPSSRDVVLASRRGLFIIDLEAPLEIPRFLPQGGTWDVADVQWNPNPSRAEYIVSTSSEKLLIWNLLLVGKTSIEHILQAHYRAITDINWHPTECDNVVSIGIDSWIWAWDIRQARKPTFGLSLFESAGTQVKWNRQDANILASSHGKTLAIWDRRKGSLPLQRIEAHDSKIYGVDWSHEKNSQITTCSLDRTIKFWDINDPSPPSYFQGSQTFNPVSAISPITPTQATHYNGSVYTNTWNTARGGGSNQGTQPHLPMSIIQTNYPVWRARNLPFGDGGVLSLAQRGETALEMYARNHSAQVPVERFEGHNDVVKEFVWRKGSGPDDFQLITWSKDRTLRFWPISDDCLAKVGHVPHTPDTDDTSMSQGRGKQRRESDRPQNSFRNPPEGNEYLPALSAPIGQRSILAEVRAAPFTSRPFLLGNYANVSPDDESGPESGKARVRRQLHSKMLIHPSRLANARSQGGKMSRGTKNGAVTKSVARMQVDAFTWLSNVKVEKAAERKATEDVESRSPFKTDKGSSLPASEGPSRAGSKSRSRLREEEENLAFVTSPEANTTALPPIQLEHDGDGMSVLERERERRDTTGESQSLQDELTSVLTKLNSPKIKLEKADLHKRRICTFGLHGPWGAGAQMVFIRVTFTFPRDYPHALYPNGIPIIDLEKNPLISPKERTFILKRLTTIREKRRPCLESCLRFLLFREEEEPSETGEETITMLVPEDDSSSEDEALPINGMGSLRRRAKGGTVMLRGNKNLVEPRTSQGIFGPNGELVCFFRDPTRVVRNVVRGLSDSPATPAEEPMTPPPPPPAEEDAPQSLRIFQSPSLISDAVRRLALSSSDRQPRNLELRRAGDKNNNILRIMTNLLTFSQSQQKTHPKEGETKPLGEILKSYALLSATPRRSMIFLASTLNLAGSDRTVAVDYIFTSEVSLSDACQKNAMFARSHGRTDHERAFRTLDAVFAGSSLEGSFSSLGIRIIQELYSDFCQNKDIQMLAMLSVFVLQWWYRAGDLHVSALPTQSSHRSPIGIPSLPSSPSGNDYFSLARALNERPPRSRLPSTKSSPGTSHVIQPMSMLSTSTSSRGSWSSLFNTGTMRNFMAGVGDSLKEGLASPLEFPTMQSHPETPIPTVRVENIDKDTTRKGGRKQRKESGPKTSPGSKWGVEVKRPLRISASSSTSSIGRPSPLTIVPDVSIVEKPRRIVFHDAPAATKASRPPPPFNAQQLKQFKAHVNFYADLLNRWELYHKRLEMLKAVKDTSRSSKGHLIGILHACRRCSTLMPQQATACPSCGYAAIMANCTVCRLPVKGLSKSCLKCFHVTHMSCWSNLDLLVCPSGCGCVCNYLFEEAQLGSSGQPGYLLSPPLSATYYP